MVGYLGGVAEPLQGSSSFVGVLLLRLLRLLQLLLALASLLLHQLLRIL